MDVKVVRPCLQALQGVGFAVDPELFPDWHHDQYLAWKFTPAEFSVVQALLVQQPVAVQVSAKLVGAMMYFSTTHEATTKWVDAIVLPYDNAPVTLFLEALGQHFRVLEQQHFHVFYSTIYPLDWHGQSFTYEDFEFDCTLGLDIVQGRESNGRVPVEHWLTHPATINIEVNPDHIQTVDINQPLLVATFPAVFGSMTLVIDGYHRLHRAHQLGIKTLKAHVLNVHETYMILRSQVYRPVWFQQVLAEKHE